jgi:DNA-binding response OmpR family regulator
MGKHVLYFEDEPLMGQLVRGVLAHQGFRVSLASSGKDGLEMARRDRPDLILLDIMMPGMDGFEVCREIRRDHQLRRIPVIMLTAMESPKLN